MKITETHTSRNFEVERGELRGTLTLDTRLIDMMDSGYIEREAEQLLKAAERDLPRRQILQEIERGMC